MIIAISGADQMDQDEYDDLSNELREAQLEIDRLNFQVERLENKLSYAEDKIETLQIQIACYAKLLGGDDEIPF